MQLKVQLDLVGHVPGWGFEVAWNNRAVGKKDSGWEFVCLHFLNERAIEDVFWQLERINFLLFLGFFCAIRIIWGSCSWTVEGAIFHIDDTFWVSINDLLERCLHFLIFVSFWARNNENFIGCYLAIRLVLSLLLYRFRIDEAIQVKNWSIAKVESGLSSLE